jgi:hypothetical protein
MKRILLIFFLCLFSASLTFSQNPTFNEMMKISKLNTSDFEKKMSSKGYLLKMIDSSNNSKESKISLLEWIFYKINISSNDTSFIYLGKLTSPDSTIQSISINVNRNFKNTILKKIISNRFKFSYTYANDVFDRESNVIKFKMVTNCYKKNNYEISISEHFNYSDGGHDNNFQITFLFKNGI